jgi:hypothetical protein
LRELLAMAEAKVRDKWAHTSAVLAMIANAHRDTKKTRPFTPADFNPMEQRQSNEPIIRTNDLSILKRVFVDKGASVGRSLKPCSHGR